MNQNDFKEVCKENLVLYGFAVKHLLEEDEEYQISSNLMYIIQRNSAKSDSVYLIRISDDFSGTQEIVTFAGSEKIFENRNFSLQSITIPRANYFMFEYSDNVEDLKEMYIKCYDFLEINNISLEANFEFEKLYSISCKKEIYFPIGKVNVAGVKSIDITTFLKNNEF
ncbi:hypothetical protein [Enterococcus faecium]|uniref:hypothetical protein n=1 Tax=Enterococcus faecium TaxID=1352 RepID=UPI000CF0B76A|nr:hypothetical protein [Enterococcus faecium]EMF0549020.1 hypothetical protein [Enterococcus faecium]PQC34431.1 hypothetical protein CUM93_03345 [Enterococcus faecium]